MRRSVMHAATRCRPGGVELARSVGLWLALDGSVLVVDRLPGRAAYPRPRAWIRLFTVSPGQLARYRANFRFTSCACNASWLKCMQGCL